MGGDDDRHALLAGQGDDELADLGHPGGVEPVGRLVQEHEGRVRQQRHGQSQALLHAHGVVLDLLVLLTDEVDGGQGVLDAVGGQPQVGGHHGQVLLAGQARVVGGALDEGADGSRRQGVALADWASQDAHAARRRAGQSQQELHRGGLAGAVGAQEAVDAAGGHGQVQAVDGVDTVVGAGQSLRDHHESLRGGGGGWGGHGAECGWGGHGAECGWGGHGAGHCWGGHGAECCWGGRGRNEGRGRLPSRCGDRCAPVHGCGLGQGCCGRGGGPWCAGDRCVSHDSMEAPRASRAHRRRPVCPPWGTTTVPQPPLVGRLRHRVIVLARQCWASDSCAHFRERLR